MLFDLERDADFFCGHQPCGQIKSPDVERIHVVAPSFTMDEVAQERHPEALAHAPYYVSDVAAAFGKFYPGSERVTFPGRALVSEEHVRPPVAAAFVPSHRTAEWDGLLREVLPFDSEHVFVDVCCRLEEREEHVEPTFCFEWWRDVFLRVHDDVKVPSLASIKKWDEGLHVRVSVVLSLP